MITVQPGAVRAELIALVPRAILVKVASQLGLCVPGLAAAVADISIPRSADGGILHVDRDPCDTDSVVPTREANVLGADAPGALSHGHVVHVSSFDVGSVTLAEVVVVCVPSIDCRKIALL